MGTAVLSCHLHISQAYSSRHGMPSRQDLSGTAPLCIYRSGNFVPACESMWRELSHNQHFEQLQMWDDTIFP